MTEHRKIAVVAGGSAGVGRAVVDALVNRGYRVAVFARGKGRLDELQAHHGDDVWTRAVNVAEQAQIDTAADAIVAELGTPEVWVNCAMLTSFSPFEKVDEQEFRRITDTTYHGTVNGCRTALRIMHRGNIVNVGSGLAYTSVPNQAAYCGAKHAIEGFTQSLRIELARDARPIALSMVQLPAINTPQFDWTRNRMDRKPQPAPPIFQPEVAAEAILKAIDEDAREILVGRSVLQLMAANFVLPDVVEAQLAKMGVEAQKSDRPDNLPGDNLDGPYEDYPSRAHGSYDGKAEESGIIVDGDTARKTALIGGAVALLALGWAFGRGTKGMVSEARSQLPSFSHDPESPYYDRPVEYRH
jgi:NAD(P)-dependent dehydrogenase (short-subunit alcohol dehydrogenase family)